MAPRLDRIFGMPCADKSMENLLEAAMSIGSAVSSPASQALAALLPQTGATAAAGASSSDSTGASPHYAAHSGHSSSAAPLTGGGAASLSSEILNLFAQMQQADGSGSGSSSSSSSTTLNSLSMSSLTLGSLDPMQQLFSALDDNSGSSNAQTVSGVGQMNAPSGQFANTFVPAPDSASGTAVGAGASGTVNAVTPSGSTNGNSLTATNFTQLLEGFQSSQSGLSQGSLTSSLLDIFAKAQGAAATSATNGITA
jgi:hypothetical protein